MALYTGIIVSYMNFILFLLLLSGWFILQFDVMRYKKRGMERELKASRWLAWFNLVIGTVGILGNWFYHNLL